MQGFELFFFFSSLSFLPSLSPSLSPFLSLICLPSLSFFLPQVCCEHLLCTRHCPRQWSTTEERTGYSACPHSTFILMCSNSLSYFMPVTLDLNFISQCAKWGYCVLFSRVVMVIKMRKYSNLNMGAQTYPLLFLLLLGCKHVFCSCPAPCGFLRLSPFSVCFYLT